MSGLFSGKRVLITGGSGSLGRALVRRILGGEEGEPKKIIVFSRGEARQHDLRLEYEQRRAATDEIIYRNFQRRLELRIGDVRDPDALDLALRDADLVIHAAAMKQLPTCEYAPFEAVKTNVLGAEHLVRAIRSHRLDVEAAVCISTDKACLPVSVLGMSKALQERIFIQANMTCGETRLVCVRYGNVLASRGSVIPLFHAQIRAGGPLTITSPEMTRFLLSLDETVDTIFAALRTAARGEIFVPRASAARIVDLATALVGERPIPRVVTGVRPGEKLHETLISDEEVARTHLSGGCFAIRPLLPELGGDRPGDGALLRAYTSRDALLDLAQVAEVLRRRRLRVEDRTGDEEWR